MNKRKEKKEKRPDHSSYFSKDKGHEILEVLLLKIIIPKGTMELFKDLDLEYNATKRIENYGSVKLWELSNNIFFDIQEDKKHNIYSKKVVKKIQRILKEYESKKRKNII